MTKIEWTEKTWNPVVGCSLASPGCANCYAMRMAARLDAMGVEHYWGLTKPSKSGPVWTGRIDFAPERVLLEPRRRKKATTYFVNSMGDLFHEAVSDSWIDDVFATMVLCPHHTFQILTKRPKRMFEYVSRLPNRRREFDCHAQLDVCAWPLPNVWLGVSCEDQKRADERIPHLLRTPAAIRFVSCEPLLGPVDLRGIWDWCPEHDFASGFCVQRNHPGVRRLNWVIAGGESGPNARPMHPDWARSLRDQCIAASVPFFFKQWGEWVTEDQSPEDAVNPSWCRCPWAEEDRHGNWTKGDQTAVWKLGKKPAGRLLDGREWNDTPVREVRI